MAINIEWQIKPPHQGGTSGEPKMYPRIIDSKVIDTRLFEKKIAKRKAVSLGVVELVLDEMREVLTDLLREGNTVHISSLGSFKLSIGTDADITPDSSHRMQSITVRGINFQPCDELLESIGKPDFRWRPRQAAPVAATVSQLLPLLNEHFKVHDRITRAEFERLFGLKRTTAYTRLKELVEMEILQEVGSNRTTSYKIKNV